MHMHQHGLSYCGYILLLLPIAVVTSKIVHLQYVKYQRDGVNHNPCTSEKAATAPQSPNAICGLSRCCARSSPSHSAAAIFMWTEMHLWRGLWSNHPMMHHHARWMMMWRSWICDNIKGQGRAYVSQVCNTQTTLMSLQFRGLLLWWHNTTN